MSPVMMPAGRARLIASECPLTWRQVQLLAYEASEEDSSWEFGHWLLWGHMMAVGEWLWQYWIQRAGEAPENRGEEACPWSDPEPWRAHGRPSCAATTASAAGLKPPRELSGGDWCRFCLEL